MRVIPSALNRKWYHFLSFKLIERARGSSYPLLLNCVRSNQVKLRNADCYNFCWWRSTGLEVSANSAMRVNVFLSCFGVVLYYLLWTHLIDVGLKIAWSPPVHQSRSIQNLSRSIPCISSIEQTWTHSFVHWNLRHYFIQCSILLLPFLPAFAFGSSW